MPSSTRFSNPGRPAQDDQGQHLANELRKRVSGEVRFDPFSRYLYSTDASMYQMDPVGVVIPRNVEDVLAVMEVASQHKTARPSQVRRHQPGGADGEPRHRHGLHQVYEQGHRP